MAKKMMVCKTCGKEIAKSAKACPYCGAKVKHHKFLWILLILFGVIIISVVAGGNTVSSKYASLSETDIRNGCTAVVYEDVARNPKNYEGKLITFTGQVIQVIEGSTITLRVNQKKDDSTNGNDTWYITYKSSPNSSRILENDRITVYGECKGTTSYKNVLGSKITIPSMVMLYYDLLAE